MATIDYTYARYLLKGEIAETVKKLNSLLDELETTGIGVGTATVHNVVTDGSFELGCHSSITLFASAETMQNLSLSLDEMSITSTCDSGEYGEYLSTKIPTAEDICLVSYDFKAFRGATK